MTIAVVVGVCVLLLVLAFVAPRLSSKPQSGLNRVFGAPGRAAGKAPGRGPLGAKALRQLEPGGEQERPAGAAGGGARCRSDASAAAGRRLPAPPLRAI